MEALDFDWIFQDNNFIKFVNILDSQAADEVYNQRSI